MIGRSFVGRLRRPLTKVDNVNVNTNKRKCRGGGVDLLSTFFIHVVTWSAVALGSFARTGDEDFAVIQVSYRTRLHTNDCTNHLE